MKVGELLTELSKYPADSGIALCGGKDILFPIVEFVLIDIKDLRFVKLSTDHEIWEAIYSGSEKKGKRTVKELIEYLARREMNIEVYPWYSEFNYYYNIKGVYSIDRFNPDKFTVNKTVVLGIEKLEVEGLQ